MVDDIVGQKAITTTMGEFRNIAILALAAAAALIPCVYFAGLLSGYLVQSIVLDLRNRLNAHILRLPLRFFHRNRSGDMLSRVTNDVQLSERSVTFVFEDLFKHPIYMIGALYVAFSATWRLSLILIVLLPLVVIPLTRLGIKIRKKRTRSLETLSNVTDHMVQTYSGIKVIKAFHTHEEEMRKFETQNLSFFRKMMSVIRKKLLGVCIVTFFNAFAVALFVIIGGYMAVQNLLTVGELGSFIVALAFVKSPMKDLTRAYTGFQESMSGFERVFNMLDIPEEAPDDPAAVEITSVDAGIEYRDVTFAYDTNPVLSDVGFRAAAGETIAVVGRSGAGKSTLLDLLCRFYDDYRGEILVNGVELRMIKRKSLLRETAVVAQETFLFNSSILDNIRYGKPGATVDEVVEAAKTANIHAFIETLDNGYETNVGERGVRLSGGQRQRIAIARAILKKPKILILDEATSSLDTESERLVQGAINNLLSGGTSGPARITFVIAHRLSTVKNADRIVVLDNGRIVESGRHDELLASPTGTYHLLYNELQ
ncbi:MAG: hypothetical protein A2Z34_00955 [Planctomycetes bacterium RBG_16_59_8]|nr:MAG: hypothetical protein A2Z34_00955 [Planctomycetes bacterium RBG_16_59_8]